MVHEKELIRCALLLACRAASANEASHSMAFAVEHATDGPPVVVMPRSRRDRAEIARRSLRDRAEIVPGTVASMLLP